MCGLALWQWSTGFCIGHTWSVRSCVLDHCGSSGSSSKVVDLLLDCLAGHSCCIVGKIAVGIVAGLQAGGSLLR